jgi:hypothetical protein
MSKQVLKPKVQQRDLASAYARSVLWTDTLYTEVSSCDEDETECPSPATEVCPTKCGTTGEDEARSSPRLMRGRRGAAGNVEDKILVE